MASHHVRALKCPYGGINDVRIININKFSAAMHLMFVYLQKFSPGFRISGSARRLHKNRISRFCFLSVVIRERYIVLVVRINTVKAMLLAIMFVLLRSGLYRLHI